MKRFISFILALCMAAGMIPMAMAAGLGTGTYNKTVVGTLNTSGARYGAKMTISSYIGQLKTTLTVDGEETPASVSVIKSGGTVDISLSRFTGFIYDAQRATSRYAYRQGSGFETMAVSDSLAVTDEKGGRVTFGESGLYSGRMNFYYSMDDLGYANISSIPSAVWQKLYWFSLGSSYVLVLSDDDISAFLEKGELWGYSWPGLRGLLIGEDDLELYQNGSFDNFRAINEYKKGRFVDIGGQWYESYAQAAYEYGMMKGNEDGTFYPHGNMLVCEAITIAARLHSIYHGGTGEFVQGSPWYDVYVGYAIERGIIEKGRFADYERPVTREEMAVILSRSVDLDKMGRINDFDSIPDVPESSGSFEAILALYNSGVLTGSEEDGSFLPDDNIIRAEVAAMIARIVKSDMRIAKGRR
ncbi:MAG: S-layer homology domain-containing protein [Clostridia bacterium]|nr:S-layer homology domain-containing protein [Clostridia bacterium]